MLFYSKRRATSSGMSWWKSWDFHHNKLLQSSVLALATTIPISVWAVPKLELVNQVSLANSNAVTVQGNYAYTGDGATLKIFDVSNPAKPTVVGTSATMPDSYIMEVVIKGNYAYVANARGGLRILDISNPQHPFEVGVYNTNQPNDGNGWTLWGVDVRDNYAYVADMGSGLRIVDISNPAKPVEVGFYDTPSLAHAVKLNGNFAYVVDWGGGLRIVDITNPKSPKEVSSVATRGITYGVAFSNDGKLAYIADYNGLRIVDISNPQSPKDISFFGTPGIAISVVADGNYVYMNSYSELKVLDVSNPQSPQQVDSYNAPVNNSGYGLGRHKLNNSLLYVPNGNLGLLILSNGESASSAILVTSVKYGEQDSNGQGYYCDATVAFKQECDGKSSCSVAVGNELCGDPIVLVVKKAEITYSCNDKVFTSTVSEYETASLSCGDTVENTTCTEWNLAKDFRMSPNQENPNRDSCGNKDVWHFLQSGDMNRNPQTYTLMPNFSTNSRYDGSPVHNWTGTEIPDVVVFKPEKDLIYSNNSQLTKYIYMHPGWSHLTVIGWRSPINGNVKVTGEIASQYNKGCSDCVGDGIKWYVDKGTTNLTAGAFPSQGFQNLQEGMVGNALANIPVTQGEFIYFAIDRNADAMGDGTRFDVTISQVGAAEPEPKKVVDLWVSDPAPDDGTEPGKASWIYFSPAVWVRNQDDNGTQYQNPIYGQDNFVYVNVKNRGTLLAKNTKVEVYRSGASMGRGWPAGWDLVGTATIDELEAGKNTTVSVKWDKDRMAAPGHYCFYVRVLNNEDPMFSTETNDLIGNTQRNNNVAWRNFDVVGMLRQVTNKFQVNLGNPKPTPATVSVVFNEKENLLKNDGSAVIITLPADLFKRWQNAGGQGENIKVLGGTNIQLLATPAKLIGVQLAANEQDLPVTMQVDAFKPAPGEGTERHYHFIAQEIDSEGNLIGGVDYDIITRAQDTDSDGDGMKDVVDNDNDNDGIDDDLEIKYGLNPLGEADAEEDSDGDGQTNREEINSGSDPTDPKSKVAYYTSHGTLKDKAGNVLAGVTIQIGDKTVVTDAAGNWEISGLVEGEYTITASKDGYVFLPQTQELGNEAYHQQVMINPLSSLALSVIPDTWQAVRQGEDLTYTMTITNGGTQTATNVTLTNQLPTGATLVSLESVEAQCNSETLICTVPTLTSGATATIKLTLHNDLTDTLKTVSTLNSTEYPVDMKTSFKAVKPHLSVTLTDTPDPVVMESALHYQAAVELSPLAPIDTATGITLSLQLPAGTELKNVTTDYGTCDSSHYPVITCQLNDLSIATPDSISRAVVDIDVQLIDASLLILTHEAKVSATNYPEHITRERTNIVVPDTAVADIVLVLDTTESMNEELNGVIAAIEKFIQEQMNKTIMPTVALVEFKDNVTLRAFTNDMNALLATVRSLAVEGGGLCPEASAEALHLAISHTKEGGIVVFSTDASPYEDADMAALAQRIKEKGIVLNAIVSGDCGDGDSHWNDPAKSSN